MKEQIENRLAKLRDEFDSGQKLFVELEDRRAKLRESLFRIAGAIQVLEETLAAPAEADGDNVEPLKKVAEST